MASILPSPIAEFTEPASFNPHSALFNCSADFCKSFINLLPSSITSPLLVKSFSPLRIALYTSSALLRATLSPPSLAALYIVPLKASLKPLLTNTFEAAPLVTIALAAAPNVKPTFFINLSPQKLAVNTFLYHCPLSSFSNSLCV